MTTLNLVNIMDAIAATLVAQSVTTTANTFAYPVPSFTPPCTIVGYPAKGDINLDLTFKRGGIEATFPVWFVAGNAVDLSARAVISAKLDGGSSTVKTALESGGGTLGSVVSSTQVLGPDVEIVAAGDGTEYLALRYDVEVLV